jgi:putative methyltransferase
VLLGSCGVVALLWADICVAGWVADEAAEMAESVIRCLPGEDKTNGFFVACFVRNEGETDGPQLGLKKKAGAPQRGANTRDQAEHVTKHGNKRKRDEADTVIRDCEAFKDPGQKSKTATPAKIAKTAKKTKALEAPEAADDEEDVTMINGGDDIGARTKTSAQVERARRKKAAQREKKKLKVNEA